MKAGHKCTVGQIEVAETRLPRCQGRTGRFGRQGIAVNFVSDENSWQAIQDLKTDLGRDIVKVATGDFDEMEKVSPFRAVALSAGRELTRSGLRIDVEIAHEEVESPTTCNDPLLAIISPRSVMTLGRAYAYHDDTSISIVQHTSHKGRQGFVIGSSPAPYI